VDGNAGTPAAERRWHRQVYHRGHGIGDAVDHQGSLVAGDAGQASPQACRSDVFEPAGGEVTEPVDPVPHVLHVATACPA
jgi:hypothetical protein